MKTVTKVADRVVMLYPLARLGPDEPQISTTARPRAWKTDPDPRVRQFVRGEAGERLRELAQQRDAAAADRPRSDAADARTPRRSDEVDMNERVMQFRIGMFVIVAGLVLTMLIVWFGESPVAAPRPGLPQGPLRRGAGRARGRRRPEERHPGRRGRRRSTSTSGPTSPTACS